MLVSNSNITITQTYTANAGSQSKDIEMDKINYSDSAVTNGNMTQNPMGEKPEIGEKPEKPMN